MKISGIYQIQSKRKPQRCYIGSAVDIKNRWNGHLSCLRKNNHHSQKLQRHFNKYGEADLQFSVLLGCEKEYLIANEQFFIDSYKPWFNNAPLAGNCLGIKHTEEQKKAKSKRQKGHFVSKETREKLSKAHKGRKLSPEHCRKMSEYRKGKPSWNKGIKLSIKHCENLSISHKGKYLGENHPMFGKKHSDESRVKMSESLKGRTAWNKGKRGISQETREKQRMSHLGKAPHKGFTHSDESRKRMSEVRKGRKASEETKRKMSLARKGKPLPEETKRRMLEEKKGVYPGKKLPPEWRQKIKDSWVIRKQKKEMEKLLMQTTLN